MIKFSKSKKTKRVEKYGIDENNFFVFDTETNGLSPRPSKFIFGCIYGKNYKKVIRTVAQFKNEFKKPMYYKKYIFAHNAEYDLQTIYGNIITELDNKAIYNGSKFICCSPDKENKVLFCDSLNILTDSVKNIGASIGLEKKEIENQYLTGRKKTKDIIVSNKMVKYCFRDCEIIFVALERFFNLIGKITMTIASSSLHYFKENYLTNDLYFDKKLSDEFFKSYYGGRTEVFKFGTNLKLDVFDINSLYPYIMKNIILPHPAYLKKIENPDLKYFNSLLLNYEGMAEIEIQTKDNYFGFLPFKENKESSLNFPNGKFTTTVNLNELRFAIEKGKYKVLKVNYCIYSTKVLKNFFTAFVNDLYLKRKETNDEFLKLVYKLIMNCLYGKFGSRELKEKIYFKSVIDAIRHIKEFKIVNYQFKYFNSERKDLFLEYTNGRILKHSIPLIASYITSGARIEILKNLIKYPKEIYYCDTDSMFLTENSNLKHLSIGTELGQFKKELKLVSEIRGLKNYSFIDLKTNKLKSKIKGISKRARFYKKTNEFKIKKYYKTNQSLRNSKETGSNYIMKKKLTLNYDKRIILDNLDTSPIIL